MFLRNSYTLLSIVPATLKVIASANNSFKIPIVGRDKTMIIEKGSSLRSHVFVEDGSTKILIAYIPLGYILLPDI